jgi:vacuolar-type H+-ATPase subunit F/Vma7
MQLVVVGGERVVRAFALLGIRGVAVKAPEEFEQAVDALVREPEVGAIVVDPTAAALSAEILPRLRKRRELPLVVALPSGEQKDGLDAIVRRTLGV